jgi:hypothetical protein
MRRSLFNWALEERVEKRLTEYSDPALAVVMKHTHELFDPEMQPDHVFFPKNRETKAATSHAARKLVDTLEAHFGHKIDPTVHPAMITPRHVANYFKTHSRGNISLEKEVAYDETYQSKGTFGKMLMWLAGRAKYFPQVTFQKEDIDEHAVREMIKHSELLGAVERWITHTDPAMVPQLREAKRVFEAIQTPKPRNMLYRGFPSSNRGPEEGFKTLSIGEKFSYIPEKPLSFTFNQGTSEDFGDLIVGVKYAHEESRMFHITNEIVIAYLVRHMKDFELHDTADFPTFGESVFLPDGKPLEMTLIQN